MIFRFYFYFLIVACFHWHCLSQPFIKSLGLSGSDVGTSFCFSSDATCAILSTTNSFSVDDDILLTKLNDSGNIIWSRRYGGSSNETAVDIESVDKGYIILGNSKSYTNGSEDIFVLRLDSNGIVIWSKVYGGLGDDYAWSIKRASFDGFIIVGRTQSFGQGGDDGFVFRINEQGELKWSSSYGTFSNDRFYDVSNTNDSGFVITGIQKNLTSGFFDQVVVKLDSTGSIVFSKNFGDGIGVSNDAGDCIKQLPDGGYLFSGQSRAFGLGGEDMCLTKINSMGELVWSKVYGNDQDDRAFDFDIQSNGDIVLAGYTKSFGAGGYDGFLAKVDSVGNRRWFKVYGGTSDEIFNEIRIVDDSYWFVGYTNSFGFGMNDAFIVRSDSSGSNSLVCSNLNVLENSVIPSELDIVQVRIDDGFEIDVNVENALFDINSMDCFDFHLKVDSIYNKGYYNVVLDANPSGGSFWENGVESNIFVPSTLGIHNLTYEIPISGFCKLEEQFDVSVVQGCRYFLTDTILNCSGFESNICIKLNASYPMNRGMRGLDLCLHYDSTILKPTGNYSLGNILTRGNDDWLNVDFRDSSSYLAIGLSYKDYVPVNAFFEGAGEIICIDFSIDASKVKAKDYQLTICSLEQDIVDIEPACWSNGSIVVSGNFALNGILSSASISSSEFLSLTKHLNIYDSLGLRNIIDITTPTFSLPLSTSDRLYFDADMSELSPVDLMRLRNGFDAYQMQNIIANNTLAPLQTDRSPLVMVAADVDLSDKIRSNDVSMLQERIVNRIEGFQQKLPERFPQSSVDWRFVEQSRINQEAAFRPSEYYPLYSPRGYCRDNVPDIPFFMENQGSCDASVQEIYQAVLLGDLTAESPGIHWERFDAQQSKVYLDIDDVNDLGNGTYRVFLHHSINAQDQLFSIDLAMDYNEDSIRFQGMDMTVEDPYVSPQWMFNDDEAQELLFTSYTMKGYPLDDHLLYMDWQTYDGKITPTHLGAVHIFYNGREVPVDIRLKSQRTTGVEQAHLLDNFVSIYPNPAKDLLTISLPKRFSDHANMVLINSLGQTVREERNETGTDKWPINLEGLAAGLYQCIVTVEGKQPVIKKLIIQ